MVKTYKVGSPEEIADNHYGVYVCYYNNETHLYLVSIEKEPNDRFIRIKVEDKNKKYIEEYEEYHTYTWGGEDDNMYREFKQLN